MRCLVIGGSSVDTLIHVPEIHSIRDDMSLWATNVVKTIGGTGAGKALCLDALGYNTHLITDLGNDLLKEEILSYFEDTTISLYPVSTDKTTAHTNLMHSNGKRISVFTSYPRVVPEMHPKIQQLLDETDLIFLNINEFCRTYIPYVKKAGKPIIVDIHDYEPGNPYHQDFIDCADILIASDIHIPDATQFMKEHITKGVETVIVTKGAKGLVAMDDTYKEYTLNGYKGLSYVDSNGAGDSFAAGFATMLYETDNLTNALLFGSVCGAAACTTYELYNRSFTKDKINTIIKGNPL